MMNVTENGWPPIGQLVKVIDTTQYNTREFYASLVEVENGGLVWMAPNNKYTRVNVPDAAFGEVYWKAVQS